MTGGAYFRLFPYRLTRKLVRRLEGAGERLVFYVHPWEYDPEHPRIRLPRVASHVGHYLNLDAMATRTRRLLADFRFVPIREAFAAELAAARASRRAAPRAPLEDGPGIDQAGPATG